MIYRYREFKPLIAETAFIAPSATIIGQVKVCQSASIWFNSILRGDINSVSIGEFSNIQDNCVLHVTHEYAVVVGDRVTVGHNVVLHGCSIEADCLIGMGSIVLDGAEVKQGSIVAAGAVVAPGSIIPSGSLVMGVPARVVRPVKPEESERFKLNWQNYCEYAREYKDPAIFERLDA